MSNLDRVSHYHLERTKKEEVGIRICLSCQNKFESRHKFNRLCDRCKKVINEMSHDHEYSVSGTRY